MVTKGKNKELCYSFILKKNPLNERSHSTALTCSTLYPCFSFAIAIYSSTVTKQCQNYSLILIALLYDRISHLTWERVSPCFNTLHRPRSPKMLNLLTALLTINKPTDHYWTFNFINFLHKLILLSFIFLL